MEQSRDAILGNRKCLRIKSNQISDLIAAMMGIDLEEGEYIESAHDEMTKRFGIEIFTTKVRNSFALPNYYLVFTDESLAVAFKLRYGEFVE